MARRRWRPWLIFGTVLAGLTVITQWGGWTGQWTWYALVLLLILLAHDLYDNAGTAANAARFVEHFHAAISKAMTPTPESVTWWLKRAMDSVEQRRIISALIASEYAIEVSRELVDLDHDTHLPDLARSLFIAAVIRKQRKVELTMALNQIEESTAIYTLLVKTDARSDNLYARALRSATGTHAGILDALGKCALADHVRRAYEELALVETSTPAERQTSSLGALAVVVSQLATNGTMTLAELRHAINVTEKVLTETLQSLEASGLIAQATTPVVPPQVEYSLTSRGEDIATRLQPLFDQIRPKGTCSRASQPDRVPGTVPSNIGFE